MVFKIQLTRSFCEHPNDSFLVRAEQLIGQLNTGIGVNHQYPEAFNHGGEGKHLQGGVLKIHICEIDHQHGAILLHDIAEGLAFQELFDPGLKYNVDI